MAYSVLLLGFDVNLYFVLCCTSGIGAGVDIVVSSVKAYVGAINKMLGFKERSPALSQIPETEERTPVSARKVADNTSMKDASVNFQC